LTNPVTSPANRRVKLAAALHSSRDCLKHGAFLVEGPRFLDASGGLKPLFIMLSLNATPEARVAAETAGRIGCDVMELDPGVFAKVSSTPAPQGIAAVFPLPGWSSEDVFRGGTVIALDGVSDPGNAGTVIRSARAFHCSGVVFLSGSAFPWNPKTTRAAAGHNISLPIITGNSLLPLTAKHPEYLFAGAQAGGVPIGEFRPRSPVCVVVGAEAHGLSDETRECVSEYISIPMAEGVDSLNAGVCASIILHHLDGNCTGFGE